MNAQPQYRLEPRTQKRASPRMVIKGKHVLAMLLLGGLLTLYELTGRAALLGDFTADAVRNFLLLIVIVAVTMLLVAQRNGRLPNIWGIWPYLLFAGWAGLSLIWSTEPGYTARDGLNLVYPILVFLLASFFLHSEKDGEVLLHILRQALTVFAVISVLFSFSALALAIQRGSWVWGVSRLQNIPLSFAPVIAPVYVVLEVAGWRRIPGWRPRWLLVGAVTLSVFLSITRIYILGLILAFTALIWLSWRRRTWRLMSIVLGIALIFSVFAVDNPVKRRMFMRPDEVTAGSLLETALIDPGKFLSADYIRLSGRNNYWTYLLSVSRSQSSALIGAGLGSSRAIMTAAPFTVPATVSHGDYVKSLAELGYIGFGLFLLCYSLLFFWSLRWALKKHLSPARKTAAAALFSLSVLAVIASLAYNPFTRTYDFLAIAAVLIAIVRSGSDSTW